MTKRNLSLDLLKLLMAIMVVGIHSGFLGDVTSLGNFVSVNGVFRIAVPIFFIINGFYFYDVINKGRVFFWFKRIFLLFVFWTLMYSFYWINNPDFSLIIVVIKNIIIGYYHLWYLPAMMGAGILLVVFYRFNNFFIFFSILVSFFLGVAIQYSSNYFTFDNSILEYFKAYNWVYRNFIFFAYPFFCLGYIINKYSLHNKFSFGVVVFSVFLGFLFLVFESYFNFIAEGRQGGFDIYVSLIFICPMIFLLFIKMDFQGDGKTLALYSSSVYFVHIFFINFLRDNFSISGTLLTLVTVFLSIITSYFIIKLHKRLTFIL